MVNVHDVRQMLLGMDIFLLVIQLLGWEFSYCHLFSHICHHYLHHHTICIDTMDTSLIIYQVQCNHQFITIIIISVLRFWTCPWSLYVSTLITTHRLFKHFLFEVQKIQTVKVHPKSKINLIHLKMQTLSIDILGI